MLLSFFILVRLAQKLFALRAAVRRPLSLTLRNLSIIHFPFSIKFYIFARWNQFSTDLWNRAILFSLLFMAMISLA
jgi:hypothetical protein